MPGPFRQLGTFPLRPGTHNVDLRSPDGQNLFQQKVDMLADKTLKLDCLIINNQKHIGHIEGGRTEQSRPSIFCRNGGAKPGKRVGN